MPNREGLPFPAQVLVLAGGVAAVGLALAPALFAVGLDGRPDDVILYFGDHRVGGTTDTLVAALVAFVFGTGGVACILKSCKELGQRDSSR